MLYMNGQIEEALRVCADVMKLAVGDNVATECTARIAIPTRPGDNPWKRRGEQWNP